MRTWPERKHRKARIEIIPMIDVMMFLLVFFVLISLNVLPALGLHVALPISAAPDKVVAPRKVTITIAKDGSILLDNDGVALDALAEKLRALRPADSKLEVIIAGDRAATLQPLITVLDALKAANVPAASIITRPQ